MMPAAHSINKHTSLAVDATETSEELGDMNRTALMTGYNRHLFDVK